MLNLRYKEKHTLTHNSQRTKGQKMLKVIIASTLLVAVAGGINAASASESTSSEPVVVSVSSGSAGVTP